MFTFTVVDVVHLGYWFLFTTLPITHRSPWGLWTTKQNKWFYHHQSRLGGPTAPAYGTLWILLAFMLAFGAFIFFREYQDQDQGIYIAMFFVVHAHVLLAKVREALFWDYRDFRATAWITFFVLGLVAAALTLITITAVNAPSNAAPAWVSFGLFIPLVLWWLYMFVISLNWARVLGVSRRDARRIRVEQKLSV